MRKLKACCFSGHGSKKLTKSEKWIAEEITKAIDKAILDGFTIFYHGACDGVDLIAAEQVILKRTDSNNIRLIAVIPYEGQANKWNEHWRERYFNVLEKCDDVITLHTKYIQGCYHERNRYMVDRSNRLIAIYDGSSLGGTRNTIKYAEKQGVEQHIITIK